MKRILKGMYLVSIIIMFFALSSCNYTSSNSGTSSSLSGFNGLSMELRVPRNELLVSSSSTSPAEFEIPYSLLIKNMGAYTVPKENAVLQISGYDPSLLNVEPSAFLFGELEGRSTTRPVGDTIVFSNSDSGLTLDDVNSIKNTYEFDLFYNLCYKYVTSLSSSVKLVPLNTLNLANEIPSQNSVSFSQGQGAPLAVTRINVFLTNNKVLLTIYVEKKSGKLIYYTDNFPPDSCGTIDFSSRNKFKVNEASLSDNTAKDCSGKEFYLDENGRGQVTCTFNLGDPITSPITSILNMDLEYYVFDSVSQRFSIKRI